MTHILMIDDHAIVRGGIKRLLAGRSSTTLHEAASAEEGLKVLHNQPVDLIILDLNLPRLGGFEALHRFLRVSPAVPILIFSMHDDAIYAARAIEAGARGYLSKGAPPGEILTAIQAVLGNGTYVEKTIAAALADRSFHNDFQRALTRRELEILRLLAKGKTLIEIAEVLGIAYKTVANTCTRLREKVGVRSVVELINVSRGLGLT